MVILFDDIVSPRTIYTKSNFMSKNCRCHCERCNLGKNFQYFNGSNKYRASWDWSGSDLKNIYDIKFLYFVFTNTYA